MQIKKVFRVEKNIKMRKTQYFGHLIKKERVQKTMLKGEVCANRSRERTRKSRTKDIVEWTKFGKHERS